MTKGARGGRAHSVYLWVVVVRCTIRVPVQHAALFEIYGANRAGGWPEQWRPAACRARNGVERQSIGLNTLKTQVL